MEINQDLIMQFGLMQKLSTGNSMLDAFLVMLFPLLFSKVIPYLQQLVDRFQSRTAAGRHRRDIAYTFTSNRYYDYDSDTPPNHKLQTAILVHLNQLPNFQNKLVSADVCLEKAPKRRQRQQQHAEGAWQVAAEGDSSSDGSGSDDCCWYPDQELEQFEIKMMPPDRQWVEIEPGLTFCRSQQQAITGEGANKSDEVTVTFSLESKSVQQIDGFICVAYDSYRAMIKGERQRSGEEQRFLYLPVLSGEEGTKEGGFTFKAYPLADSKDFSNFFHPEKAEILNLVEAFSNKTGKFAIKGYPQKLGFLLHGPPGTGKTSFIRAIASYTKRSIVNIPLSRIRTNQQLMSLMMDQQLRVEGDDYCRPLPHSKVIYVCEDVDAASHVVQKRGVVDPITAALSSLAVPANYLQLPAADCNANATTSDVLGTRGSPDATKAVSSSKPGVSSSSPVAGPVPRARRWEAGGSDDLNLAGLLNVLDGVVDTPGRLLVLSTNHPEMLDPALIRPGRINRKIYMGHMAAREALQLVQHWFGDLTPQQQEAFAVTWRDDTVSPAALEALCAECEDVDSLLKGVAVLMAHAEASKERGSPSGPSLSTSGKPQAVAESSATSTNSESSAASTDSESASMCDHRLNNSVGVPSEVAGSGGDHTGTSTEPLVDTGKLFSCGSTGSQSEGLTTRHTV